MVPSRSVLQLRPTDLKLEKMSGKGIIFIPGVIDQVAAANFVLEILDVGLSRDKAAQTPIWVVILDSPGGEVYAGLAIFDAIRMMVQKGFVVNTLVMGLAASMAAVISQAGTKRFAGPNGQFLIHKAFTMGGGLEGENEDDLEQRKAALKKVSDRSLSLIANRCGMTLENLKKKFSGKKDYWLDAEEAKKFGPKGLMDEILTSFPFDF